MNQALDIIYENRFYGSEEDRNRVWQVLTKYYFQRWIRISDVVLDVGAGYCEFINNIQARTKYALDLNPVMPLKAAPEVTVLNQNATEINIPADSVDVAFTSNFFEHLPDKAALQACLLEVHRVLKPGGLLLAMGPNIRFCYDVYWDFFDHFIPLSDRSLGEALKMTGFRLETITPRFLPYTMKDKKPPLPILIRAYLNLHFCWRFMGKQFLIMARKPPLDNNNRREKRPKT